MEPGGASVKIMYDRTKRKTHLMKDEKFRNMNHYSNEV
jgi:hypothetical protein